MSILNFFSSIIFLNESRKYAEHELFLILVRAKIFFLFLKHFLFLSFFFLTGNYESLQHKPLIFLVIIFFFFSEFRSYLYRSNLLIFYKIRQNGHWSILFQNRIGLQRVKRRPGTICTVRTQTCGLKYIVSTHLFLYLVM